MCKYIGSQKEHQPELIQTLRVKLLDYYGCMRNFDICDYLNAEIIHQSQFTPIQDNKIKAQYLISVGYQYRNYTPNFLLSEHNYQASEALSLSLIDNPKTSEPEKQECIDLLFCAMISRFWLYAHYEKNRSKANDTLRELQKIHNKTSVSPYRLAYYFFVGSYYIKNEDYKQAANTLKYADQEQPEKETMWFFNRLCPSIKELLETAEKAIEPTHSESPKDKNRFFLGIPQPEESIFTDSFKNQPNQ